MNRLTERDWEDDEEDKERKRERKRKKELERQKETVELSSTGRSLRVSLSPPNETHAGKKKLHEQHDLTDDLLSVRLQTHRCYPYGHLDEYPDAPLHHRLPHHEHLSVSTEAVGRHTGHVLRHTGHHRHTNIFQQGKQAWTWLLNWFLLLWNMNFNR